MTFHEHAQKMADGLVAGTDVWPDYHAMVAEYERLREALVETRRNLVNVPSNAYIDRCMDRALAVATDALTPKEES